MTGRRTRAAWWALVAAALIAAAATATAAPAANGPRAQVALAPDSNFPDMAFTVSLPRNQALTAAQVHVTENRSPVRDVSVTKPGAENVAAVLLIDASRSMTGQPIVEAMAAARAFAARRNPGQQLALVTFNDSVDVLLPLTTDAKLIDAALARVPQLATGTHIYDGLQRSAELLHEARIPRGSIVLLSDGKDVGSTVSQEDAIKSVNEAEARVFAVGLHSPQFNPDALRTIVAQTSGTYSEASSAAALREIYSELGYTLSHEYVLRYRSLAGPDAKIVVAVRIDGVPGTARAGYTTPPIETVAPLEGPSRWDRIVQSSITLFAVILVVVALVGWAIFRILYRPDQDLTRRIGQFVTLPEDEQARQREAEAAASVSPDDGAGSARWESWRGELAIAGIETPPRTIALITVFGGFVLGIIVAVLIGSPLGLLAILAAPLIAKFVINRRLSFVRRNFSDQLPDNLDVLSSGLRAGHSFTGALAVCVEDAAEPSKAEFLRVIADEQLGVPIDEALHVTGRRMVNRDIVQVALVAKLQREAGTNAADVLDQVAENVRARLELRRLIASLTAQGRMARWIVSLLPVLLFLAIYALNKDYLRPLWTEPAGIVGLVAAVIMIIAGSLIIKRIVNIEV